MSPSLPQILILVGLIVLLFGVKKIPELGKSLGEAIRGFKKGISDDEIDVTDSTKSEQLKDNDSDNDNDKATSAQKEKTTEKV